MSRKAVSYHVAIKREWKRAVDKRAKADKRALRAAREMAQRLLGNQQPYRTQTLEEMIREYSDGNR